MLNAGLDRQDAGWLCVCPFQDVGGGIETDKVGGDGKGTAEKDEAAGEAEEEDEEEEEPCSS
jgi:hypothetical protein